MRYLQTQIELLPGFLPSMVVRKLLLLCFEKFRWFTPIRFGTASLKKRLDPSRPDFDALLAHYEEWKYLYVAARTDQNFIAIEPAMPGVPPYTGSMLWMTSERLASKSAWCEAHVPQVAEIMHILNSPLAIAASDKDIHGKKNRLVPDDGALTEVFTVRDYSEGLAGLFWRNFYGPPFVRLFGDRLTSLPAEYRRDLGNGIVLVEPYPLPGDAETAEGKARERSLIEHLGPECFYDHQRHTKPTRLPDLSSLPAPRP